MDKPQQQPNFSEVVSLIKKARIDALKVVNKRLIDLYWNIGKYICSRTEAEGWGKSTVSQLAIYIQTQMPESRGFSDKNLWRMKQFFETYAHLPKLSPLLREISWSHNLAIFSRCKTTEEKEFYLMLSKKENYSLRELERQISASLFERVVIGNQKPSTVLRELHPQYFVINLSRNTTVIG